jgi:hypothetical protein
MSIRREQEITTQSDQVEEIDSLIEELQALRLDFEERSEALALRIQRLQFTQEAPPPRPTRGNPYLVQDIVRITNNYQGQRGTQGVVVRVTPRRVVLRTEGNREYTRSYRNVELVPQDEDLQFEQGTAQ